MFPRCWQAVSNTDPPTGRFIEALPGVDYRMLPVDGRVSQEVAPTPNPSSARRSLRPAERSQRASHSDARELRGINVLALWEAPLLG